ncbi:MAG: alpha/beta hydrolase fold domain-containing protein [Austwickia sp.]|nr:alpha/beta hydrolase fold domain-containing protein [Austwickia sp.]MBK8437251.1 alpha/beta hydrolase fold domain-containing protein [Austwickia sp.]MBK9102483.1 alpha/beta hydrolase fold domain-containing protein [Austwickia sp.]
MTRSTQAPPIDAPDSPRQSPPDRAPWPSRQMRLVARVLASEPKLMADAEAFAEAHLTREYPRPPRVPAALRLVAHVRRDELDGFAVFTVTPRRSAGTPSRSHAAQTAPAAAETVPASRWDVVYLHGGGYCGELIDVHWEIVLNLLRHTGATITVPCYPLAPEHTHEVGHAWVERVYRGLLTRMSADRVVLMGDSAGGGMCLAQAMRYRDAGLPLPARLILFAPWVNVEATNPDIAAVEPRDPVLARPGGLLAGQWWAGADSTAHPQVSPLNGDVHGLPPVDLYTGTADILMPDVRLLAAKLAAAGGGVRLVEYPDAIHVYVGAAFTPEARDTYRRIADTLGTADARYPAQTRLVASPTALFSRQATMRARAASTPWIRHVGVRARLHLDRAAAGNHAKPTGGDALG